MIKNRTVPFFIIFLLLIIFLISCSTTERSEHPKNILNYSDSTELEKILNNYSLYKLSWLGQDIALLESKLYILRHEKEPYMVELQLSDIESWIKLVESQIKSHKENIHNFKRRIENTEIFLKNNADGALSIKLASFRGELRKYEEIIEEDEKRFKLLTDQYLADTRKKDARRKSYKEHISKGIDDIGINSEYILSNDSSILIIDSLYYFKKRIYLTVKLIVLPYSNAHIEHFHLYDKFVGHLGSPEDESTSYLYDSRDQGEPRVYIYKRGFSAENIRNNGELKIILQGDNVNYEKTLKYAELDYAKTIPASNINDFSKKDIKEKDFVSEITKIQGKRKGEHLLIPVWLDIHGIEIFAELLLDTGASITTIPYNLYKTGNPFNLNNLKKERFQTANGIVIAPIDKLKLRTSAYTKEIEVALSDSDVSLIGANYFEGNVYTVDLTNESIYIHPKYSHK